MDEEEIEIMIESIDNVLFAAEGPTSHIIPDRIHKEGCISKLKEVKEFLETINKSGIIKE